MLIGQLEWADVVERLGLGAGIALMLLGGIGWLIAYVIRRLFGAKHGILTGLANTVGTRAVSFLDHLQTNNEASVLAHQEQASDGKALRLAGGHFADAIQGIANKMGAGEEIRPHILCIKSKLDQK
jgi:hypothetical protein